MYQTWDKITPTATPCAVAVYAEQLTQKDALIAALEKRVELLQGVAGLRATIGKQATKIRSLKQTHAKVKKRNGELSRQVASLRRQVDSLQQKNAKHAQTIEALLQTIEQRDCEISKLCAQRRRSNRHRFGKRSESNRRPSERQRGAQPGHAGHGRTPDAHLARIEASYSLDKAPCCPHCNKPYALHSVIESERKEIEVKAHKRVIRRDHYRCACQCEVVPQSVTAPAPAQLFPGGEYGTSVWREYLFMRFSMLLTLGNVSRWFAAAQMPISKGTLVSHDADFVVLFKGLYELIGEQQMQADFVQMDETSWRVQEIDTGTTKWWCWVCVTADAVRYSIESNRDAASGRKLIEHISAGKYLMCDRYSVYPALAAEFGLTVVVCWFHARKDFTDAECGHPELKRWSGAWVKRFAKIYRLDDQRLVHYDPALARTAQSASFQRAEARLRQAVDGFFTCARQQLAGVARSSAKYVPLNRLVKYQTEMTHFLDHPWLPKDNNTSEQMLRGQAIVRKLSFGSKTPGAAQLNSVMLSVLETLKLHGVDVRQWLVRYLSACAEAGGVPADLQSYLPWNKSPQAP